MGFKFLLELKTFKPKKHLNHDTNDKATEHLTGNGNKYTSINKGEKWLFFSSVIKKRRDMR